MKRLLILSLVVFSVLLTSFVVPASSAGGEFFGNKPVAAGSDGVLSSVLPGYFLDGPDGEASVHYAQKVGGLIQVYRGDWNPEPSMGETGFGGAVLAATFTP